MNLPEDIVFEILSRLPAKEVGRCRCVSKPIRSLTMEPSFIKAHSQHSVSSSSSRNQPFFLNYRNAVAKVCDRRTPQQDVFTFRWAPFNPPPSEYLSLVGCSGGLVCLAKYKLGTESPNCIYLWNPALGRRRRELHLEDCPEFLALGFGYDSVNDDYKVVYLKGGTAKSEVYSLKKGTWKDVISQPFPLQQQHPPCAGMYIKKNASVMVNGFMHWICMCLCCDDGSGSVPPMKHHVVRFELAAEVFDDRLSIPHGEPERYREYSLDALDGQLCAFCIFHGHMDLWVMTEYGEVESWIKKYVIINERYFKRSPPLGITLRGEILLLARHTGVTLYDPDVTATEEEKNKPFYIFLDDLTTPFVANYTDCLVSVAEAGKGRGRGKGGGFLTNTVRTFFRILKAVNSLHGY